MAPSSDKALRIRLAAHLRRVIAENGWTQARLAKEIGVHRLTLHSMVVGKRTMGLDFFAKLHWKLGQDANQLLDEDPPQQYFESGGERDDVAAALREIDALVGDPASAALGRRLKGVAARLRRIAAKR